MSYAITDYLTRVRGFINDSTNANWVRQDDLTPQVLASTSTSTNQGTATNFICGNINIVSSNLQFSADGAGFTSTGVTLTSNAQGFITLTSAPKFTLQVQYYYQQLTDVDLIELINHGLERVGTNNANLGALDPSLFSVANYYAASAAARKLEFRYAQAVTMGAEGKTAALSDMAKKYKELADQLEKQADKERKESYGLRQERSTVPQFSINTYGYSNAGRWPKR